jgi:hypothetical protein
MFNHKFKILLLLPIVLLLNGCLGSLILEKNERQSFAELNLEREKAGLRALTWSEYHNHGLTEEYASYQ